MLAIELLLNLCWLLLTLPAFLLWRRRDSCKARGSAIFICTLGCVLVLLFPVISASDDLHSGAQAIEESKRALRQGIGSAGDHSITHFSQPALPVAGGIQFNMAHEGTAFAFLPHSFQALLAVGWLGRAPPA